jgi:hypothetical protein
MRASPYTSNEGRFNRQASARRPRVPAFPAVSSRGDRGRAKRRGSAPEDACACLPDSIAWTRDAIAWSADAIASTSEPNTLSRGPDRRPSTRARAPQVTFDRPKKGSAHRKSNYLKDVLRVGMAYSQSPLTDIRATIAEPSDHHTWHAPTLATTHLELPAQYEIRATVRK